MRAVWAAALHNAMPPADGRGGAHLIDFAAVSSARSIPIWAVLLLALVGLTLLYRVPLATRFLNDDYLFLEQARTQPLSHSLTTLDALGNYYRPLSRQFYFAALTPLWGGAPWVFHAFNYALFLVALALLADLLLALMPLGGAIAGVAYFALLPFQRVVLMWVSCSQDLLALAGTLAALALYRRGRTGGALCACAAALASKESAFPLVVGLLAWDWLVERRDAPAIARRIAPFAALTLAWGAFSLAMRASKAAAPLYMTPGSFAAAYLHLLQALTGIEQPRATLTAMVQHSPALIPLVALLPLTLLAFRGAADEAAGGATPTRGIIGFALVWLVAFTAVTGPVAYSWSAYYYTLAAVGGAVLVGVLMRHTRAPGLAALIAGLLWLHAGSSATRGFAVNNSPWTWSSHLTSAYFERAAALTDSMSVQLKRLEPDPPADARLFFATLPPYAGFQMGNGALVRELYRKPQIESHFMSQFSDSTAGTHPCRFLYWDGESLAPLYTRGTDVYFQVGCDLLLLDRLERGLYAFRRGAAAGESRRDLLYWISWGELWAGRRAAAERAWTELGFSDDSLSWITHLRDAHNALVDGDTLASRRQLTAAIQYGVGRPEAHAVLGELLTGRNTKYGLLELKVATRLNPRDWVARAALARGLASVQLDDPARYELAALLTQQPELRGDSTLAALQHELALRAPQTGPDAIFK